MIAQRVYVGLVISDDSVRGENQGQLLFNLQYFMLGSSERLAVLPFLGLTQTEVVVQEEAGILTAQGRIPRGH